MSETRWPKEYFSILVHHERSHDSLLDRKNREQKKNSDNASTIFSLPYHFLLNVCEHCLPIFSTSNKSFFVSVHVSIERVTSLTSMIYCIPALEDFCPP
mmetsp:Transcript_14687/g.19170  ORF Transcript_14687/g.19170 Transcript_14687/m.19170 type:complete len:99 (+) Transcript_14687:1376-1672(+)